MGNLKIHQFHKINTIGTDYFVGDIHGEYNKLITKLKDVNFDHKKDRLFSVGDLIDRGPASMDCLRLLSEDWFYAVIGNHEDMVLRRMIGRPADRYFAEQMHDQNGGRWFGQLNLSQKLEAQTLVEAIPLARTIATAYGSIGVIHAAWYCDWGRLQRAENLTPDEFEFATWVRHDAPQMRSAVAGVDAVISGHQNDPGPRKRGNQIWIDTLGQSKELTLLSAEQVFELLSHADGIVRPS